MKLLFPLATLFPSPAALADASLATAPQDAAASGAILRSPLFWFPLIGVGMLMMAGFVVWLIKRKSR